MKFEPTYDYSQPDLTKEENQILWKFGELIKTLIIISSDTEKQKYIISIGAVADEMALDFDSYFTLSYAQYLDKQLLTSEAFNELLLLDKIFDKHSGDKDTEFWNDLLLVSNNDWKAVRQKAKSILKIMNMDYLNIECIHQNISYNGVIIGKETKTRLIKKA